jgi:8-oxo-dGTP diphosphatase
VNKKISNLLPWRVYHDLSATHQEFSIISYAVQRLRWKIEYTNVVYSLLSREFTLSDLQKVYEAILGKFIDKRNFRKKILSLHFLQPTRKIKIGRARPALFYTFKEKKPVIVNIF